MRAQLLYSNLSKRVKPCASLQSVPFVYLITRQSGRNAIDDYDTVVYRIGLLNVAAKHNVLRFEFAVSLATTKGRSRRSVINVTKLPNDARRNRFDADGVSAGIL